MKSIGYKNNISSELTEGLLGNPTRCPQVVNRLTRHSLTLPCDIHGRFHPLNVAVSAGDRLVLRLGEFGVPDIFEFDGWLIFA